MPKVIEFESTVRKYPTKYRPRFQMSIPNDRPVKPNHNYRVTMVELTEEGTIADGQQKENNVSGVPLAEKSPSHDPSPFHNEKEGR